MFFWKFLKCFLKFFWDPQIIFVKTLIGSHFFCLHFTLRFIKLIIKIPVFKICSKILQILFNTQNFLKILSIFFQFAFIQISRKFFWKFIQNFDEVLRGIEVLPKVS